MPRSDQAKQDREGVSFAIPMQRDTYRSEDGFPVFGKPLRLHISERSGNRAVLYRIAAAAQYCPHMDTTHGLYLLVVQYGGWQQQCKEFVERCS